MATSWCLSIVLRERPAAWWNKHFTLCSDTDDISFVCFVCCSRFWWNGLFSFVWLPGCVDVSVRAKSVTYFSIRLRQMASEIESLQQGSAVLFSTQSSVHRSQTVQNWLKWSSFVSINCLDRNFPLWKRRVLNCIECALAVYFKSQACF